MLFELIRLRKENRLSQLKLGEMIGKKQRMISKYEREDVELPVSVAKKIAEVFDVDWWKLYE
ncbi:helix-turn-helix transcriptional regulator [uncultured Finegoldia sp.]|uniref:helix-turn-helix domain-containing protein n=1 Tax=uncultured Finegoldia sp. TaxID=328009 RepID=UPI00280610C9|nr:helix-turn-helix transcriptional regulator [uncultured Finegoldia sp.]MDU1409814.1 helix-turn-helix transcriptional regulator [Veillonella sp.]